MTIALVGAAAGVATGFSLLAGVAVLLAPLAVYATFLRPFFGVAVVVASIPLELVVVFEGGVTLSRVIALAVGIGWLIRKLSKGERLYPLLKMDFSKASALFITFVLVSAFWAVRTNVVVVGTVQMLQLFLLSLMMVDVASTPGRIRWLVRTMVVAAMVAAFLTVQASMGGSRRAGGDIAGINGTAELLVVCTPLAFWMLWTERALAWRIVGVLFPAFAFGAIAATLSRMSFLFLPIVVTGMVIETIRVRRGRKLLGVVALVMVVAGATLVPLDRVITRAASIPDYLNGLAVAEGGADVEMSGRGYHLKIAVEIFKDHPIIGVGYGHYGLYFLREYQHTVSGSEGLYRKWRSPHSSHVGMLADLGLVGVAFWGIFLLVPFLGLWKAQRILKYVGDPSDWLFSKAVLYSFLIEVVPYGLYGPNQKEKLFWFLMGLAVIGGLVGANAARRARASRAVHRPTGRPDPLAALPTRRQMSPPPRWRPLPEV